LRFACFCAADIADAASHGASAARYLAERRSAMMMLKMAELPPLSLFSATAEFLVYERFALCPAASAIASERER